MAKISISERKKFYREALEEQRHLLRTAIQGMVDGDLTQALRVATSIRVLVHETGRQKPLLKNLNNNYLELPILDRVHAKNVIVFCPMNAEIRSGVVHLIPELNPKEYVFSQIGSWWINACMALPDVGAVDRRELILGLSDKEGGAHVDGDISEKYMKIMTSKFFNTKVGSGAIEPVSVSRLLAGRAGIELLDCLEKNFPVS